MLLHVAKDVELGANLGDGCDHEHGQDGRVGRVELQRVELLASRPGLVKQDSARVRVCEVVLHWLGFGRDVVDETTHGIGIHQSSGVDVVDRLDAHHNVESLVRLSFSFYKAD